MHYKPWYRVLLLILSSRRFRTQDCVFTETIMQFSAMLLHTRQGPVPHSSQPCLTNFHRFGLAGLPGRAFWQQQFHGIRQRRQCVVTKAKDLNSGWQLRETDPLQKAPVGSAIVVGAGVAGLVSALGLAKFGMQVDVCDQTTSHTEPRRGAHSHIQYQGTCIHVAGVRQRYDRRGCRHCSSAHCAVQPVLACVAQCRM